MIYDVEKRLVAVHNELKAQKVFSGLTYSQLLLPENAPTETYSGTIDLSGGTSGPVARLRFRFTRADGLLEPPLVTFTQDISISPTYKQFAESYGFVFNANDLSYITFLLTSPYIGQLGDGFVDFYVDFNSLIRNQFFSLSSISMSVIVQAIANVKGSLEVERLI